MASNTATPADVREKLIVTLRGAGFIGTYGRDGRRALDLWEAEMLSDAILAAFPAIAVARALATKHDISPASSLTAEITDAITAAEARVREECAKIADEHRQELFEDGLSADVHGMTPTEIFVAGCEQERECIAAAIRAGGGR